MSNQKTKLELTWIGKDQYVKLEPRILLEDLDKSYHAKICISENEIFDNQFARHHITIFLLVKAS